MFDLRRPVSHYDGGWWMYDGYTWLTNETSALYAKRLAEQGFVALTFDFRGYGESSGEPRKYESVQYKAQDFKNALTFLRSQPVVDPERTGGLAICASAGYMARAIAEDTRFKCFVAVAGWFQHPERGTFGPRALMEELDAIRDNSSPAARRSSCRCPRLG